MSKWLREWLYVLLVVGGFVMILNVGLALYIDYRSVYKDLAWDAPAPPIPDGYRIYLTDVPLRVDGVVRKLIFDGPPPPVTEPCHCFMVKVKIPPGQHIIELVAYTTFSGERIESPPTQLRVNAP